MTSAESPTPSGIETVRPGLGPKVLEAVEWNKKEAARVLDISRGTLYRKILEYQLEPEPRSGGRRAHEGGA